VTFHDNSIITTRYKDHYRHIPPQLNIQTGSKLSKAIKIQSIPQHGSLIIMKLLPNHVTIFYCVQSRRPNSAITQTRHGTKIPSNTRSHGSSQRVSWRPTTFTVFHRPLSEISTRNYNAYSEASYTSTHYIVDIRTYKKGKVHPCTGTEALYRPYGL